jgi:hypothetical protein
VHPVLRLLVSTFATVVVLAGCGADDHSSSQLTSEATWHWQLQGEIDTGVEADVYDVDLFEVTDEALARLRADGRIVICYFSAGSYEAWRPDATAFDPADVGATLDGWEDERWVDVRSTTVRDVMAARLDLAVERGCDGVEPDNVTAHDNDTGFDVAADDQLDYNRFIAEGAQSRGLLVGLKNDLGQIPALVDDFDFAVNEQCHEFDECDVYEPFVAQDKPVFNAEYAEAFVAASSEVCAASSELGLRTVIVPVDLDGSFRIGCD